MKNNKKRRKINWSKRFSNKLFLTSLASTVLLLITQLGLFPIPPDSEGIVNSILTLLTLGGVLTDPTTDGMWDSDMALSEESSAEHDSAIYENVGRKFAELDGLNQKLNKLGLSDYFDYEAYGRQQLHNYPSDSSYSFEDNGTEG